MQGIIEFYRKIQGNNFLSQNKYSKNKVYIAQFIICLSVI